MADGVTTQTATLATIPDATEIATDDAGAAGHVQIIKLAISADGSATVLPGDATNGLDVDVTRLSALVAGSASIGKVGLDPQTAGGLTTFHLVSAGSTNATVVKASAGQLFGWYIYNSNAAARKVAFHNSASAPTAGASVFAALVIPPLSAANVELTNGIAFSAGIAITTVTELTDAGTTAVAASDLVLDLFYK